MTPTGATDFKINPWLIAGGWLSLAASALHIGCILGGSDWYRMFGAPEPLIQALERGDDSLAYMTVSIAVILAIWAAYAFSGAGVIRRLPLIRTALVVISAIYLLRGLLIFPTLFQPPAEQYSLMVWSSLVVLIYGLIYCVGTAKAWPSLSKKANLPKKADLLKKECD